MPETRLRICPFCEATCGLTLELNGRQVTSVRGDDDDVFSKGFLCPKGAALVELDGDPDRLRRPLVRRDGRLVETTWDEAFAEIERRLPAIAQQHGKDAIAVYLGNPSVHNVGLALYGQVFLRALRTSNVYSASTVDQIPKQLASGLMYGTYTTVAVPDIDRTDLLLIFGADPMSSNGSLWTVPDFPGRLRALQRRGGRCLVFDPRRSRTAEVADRHYFVRPGSDAQLLMALVHTLFAEDLVRPGKLLEHVDGFAALRAAAADFTPELVAPICGMAADDIVAIARQLAAAPRAALYGRIGTCTQEFGTLASWLIDVLNVLTGNLDRPGGAMFPKSAAYAANTHGEPGVGSGIRIGRRHSRVRQAPEVMGELPVACLAEEIETPGVGQVRALVTIAGNPVLSTPNGARLSRALESLEFMVSLDIYLNETSRHADVVLPGMTPLETSHFDAIFPQFGYRNAARYSPPVLPPPAQAQAEWQSLLRLTGIITGQGVQADLDGLDDFVAMTQIQRAVGDTRSPVYGRKAAEILECLTPRRGPERLIDLALQCGPYGAGFGANPAGVSLRLLEENPHGIDLGELTPRLPELLRTPSGKIELAPQLLLADVERLRRSLEARHGNGRLQLVGRRHLRSNNSWLHNLPRLSGGRPRCTLLIHPLDAAERGLVDGGKASLRSRVGEVEVDVEISEAMMPGVVSLPHGWGHDVEGTRLQVAARSPGVNSNRLSDEAALDVVSGNAVLNGIPVEIATIR
ncbi:MAG TPA: molybdopterin oxidoreductase family protein [Terriglobales bacterium]|nr:molybdopterin oxidoreductase family protein [Terriglobales bacterium]